MYFFALAVAGVLVATLTPIARLVVHVTLPYNCDTVYCSCMGVAAYGKGGGISAAARAALSAAAAIAAPPLTRNTQGVEPTQRLGTLAAAAANRLGLDDDDQLGLVAVVSWV
jgi:hypothetical protein